MTIDLKPAVGRILLARARSTEFYPWYEKAGKITRISGLRVYYTNSEGAEKFLHEWAAVVDKAVEEEELLDFTVQAKKEVALLQAKIEAADKLLWDECAVATTAKRVRRVKP